MGGWPRVVALLGLLAATGAAAEDAPSLLDHVTFSASLRVRGEFVDWFAPPPTAAPSGAERYAFFASQLRAGVRVLFPHLEVFAELQDTRLTGLPDDATLAPPQGALGPGALYFLHTRETTQGEPFLKQGFVTLRRGGLAGTLGRFEYRDGLETIPADATLATLKRLRIAERLVGTFDFTHVTRSFDGARLTWDDATWNASAFAVRPTRGGFEISANRDLVDVGLAGAALGLKRLPIGPPVDARLFYLYYEDRRRLVKADNGGSFRHPDTSAIVLHTVGAHALTAIDAGPGIVDLLGWAVAQTGDWGALRHEAWAYAIEGGYQLPGLPWSPWLHGGMDRSSGDHDPSDGTHGTFFQILPTARTYAQLPFFNLMNLTDVFTMLVLRPHEIVTLRTDWHWLRLTEGRDLWYSGGGATKDDLFGYAGSPANGRSALAHVVDLSATVELHEQLVIGAYYGHAFGGAVVGQTFAGRDADYGFIEATWRLAR